MKPGTTVDYATAPGHGDGDAFKLELDTLNATVLETVCQANIIGKLVLAVAVSLPSCINPA